MDSKLVPVELSEMVLRIWNVSGSEHVGGDLVAVVAVAVNQALTGGHGILAP